MRFIGLRLSGMFTHSLIEPIQAWWMRCATITSTGQLNGTTFRSGGSFDRGYEAVKAGRSATLRRVGISIATTAPVRGAAGLIAVIILSRKPGDGFDRRSGLSGH
jgi:hypothetical protein